MNKSELRTYIRRQFRTTTSEDRARWSEDICHRLASDTRIKKATCILAFYPLKDEVNILPLVDMLRKEGKTILMPVVVSDSELAVRIYDGDRNMEQGVLGTSHPLGEDYSDYNKIDVALVPGQAFDRERHRLGRGKGYYDRFLEKLPNAYTIGVCFPYQVVDSVPHDSHDITIDHV